MAIVLLSLVFAGCGGDSKAGEKGAASGGSEPAAAEESGDGATTTTTAKPKAKAGSSSEKKSDGKSTPPPTAKPGDPLVINEDAPSADDEDPYKRTLAIKAELAETCVKPGGSQTVTIRTLPYAGVGYDTEYSDYLTGMMEGHYGGNAGGFTDDDGTWTNTWVIAPNAPSGLTTVKVLGSHHEGGIGETRAEFQVADVLGKCA